MFPFSSFWQAGYEGADHINTQGKKLSMNMLNKHNKQFDEDYALLLPFGIYTIRESIGWRLSEINIDKMFITLKNKMRAAQRYGIQINWILCHYGYPEDINIFSSTFVSRFTFFCQRIATFLSDYYNEQPPIYSLINEISFMSWGISTGLLSNNKKYDPNAVKRQLIRATISGCKAILSVDSRARFLHCDPIIQVIGKNTTESEQQTAAAINESQFQAWDMLAGLYEPELGGDPRYLDIIGANYYHNNQWIINSPKQKLEWHLGDSRRIPLHEMLSNLFKRYRRPILLSETSHVGSGRAAWLNHITTQIAQAQLNGCDIRGICLYPILDYPLWENIQYWPHSGLWDINLKFERILNTVYSSTLKQSKRSLDNFQSFLTLTKKTKDSIMKDLVLVVFSHLRWNFVFQRPQHIMLRLAQYYRIFFIEEPLFQTGKSPYLREYKPAPNITVFQPYTDIELPGFQVDQIKVLYPLITNLFSNEQKILAWFYTPMAFPLVNCFSSSIVIYDCMDELSEFKLAPSAELQRRESELLNSADLVFTGGHSLYECKKNLHPRVYCFPSSVDAAHFEQALDRNNTHPLQEHLPKPRLGYYGVIDERIDIELIKLLAISHPEWQILMVGPIVKIDPNDLPQYSNLHWLGIQPYEALPHFLAGWDICLIPFVLNNSTKFVSPTKVLEYMAAQLPIVSTAIKDIELSYSNIINIAYSYDNFIEACENILTLTIKDLNNLAIKMKSIVSATSWDKTVEQMQSYIIKLYK
ncbi:glycosyltransferase [Pantoea sp. Mhis]|uniref:glycosyltransferase n=1 Tax=Pantoea sp. Mhis TaxID=2576759 RepID=UPI00135B86AD|nr:glycosyltransferase [Pantoea sp. Mhis]MXP56776.1 glycosyltransferase family 1 protein [Pantoea sp. Mhis]